jgi:hypothetical protein
MEKKKKSIGLFIIASAIIWGAMIIGCSLKLKDTGCFDQISYILSAGFIFHLLFVWGPIAIQFKKMKKEE